jgi:sporulation protein YlmC with PRC-barrel domain
VPKFQLGANIADTFTCVESGLREPNGQLRLSFSKGDHMQRVELSKLINMPVRHPDGQKLGEIEEIYLDPSQGSVDRVSLRLRTDRKLHVIVPWSQLRLADSKNCLELEISRQTLEAVAMRR